MRRTFSVSVAAVAAACITAGCGAGTDFATDAAEPSKGDTVAISDSQLRDLTISEEMEIEYAEYALVKRCMEDKGFSYWVGPVASVDARKAGRYVIDDIAWAKKYGYGRPFDEAAERERSEHPNVRFPNALPRNDRIRYNTALNGDYDDVLSVDLPAGGTIETPRTGCWAGARTHLYGDLKAWFEAKKTVTSLTPLYVPEILADERMNRTVSAWSSCMKEAGQRFSSPDDLREKRIEHTAGMRSEVARKYDVELAVTEATCAVKTSLGKVARHLEGEYRSSTLKKYGKENAAYQRMGLAALSRARDLTSE
ncbi:hypothetical protein J7E90_01285 [Streptomyces sp. ISL-111]|uniref:hypothetical protein n=1 Tax=Streptomyces sp. ISL-111 TaxID=2819175 RepID=UPI001BE9D6AE|nr:hypothetical protein [Streptomyces sp. ISL-111]MBT2376034.1 hypothetical protein [Streptomyces sp. ISL-111]